MHSKYFEGPSRNLPPVVYVCTCSYWFGLNSLLCILTPLPVSTGFVFHPGFFLVTLFPGVAMCCLLHLSAGSWHLPSSWLGISYLSSRISWNWYLLLIYLLVTFLFLEARELGNIQVDGAEQYTQVILLQRVWPFFYLTTAFSSVCSHAIWCWKDTG